MTAGRTVVSQRRDWGTPQKYADAAEKMLGRIGLDPCSNQDSIVPASTTYLLPDQDGLHLPWLAESIYVNPPYGRDPERGTTIRDWLARCSEAGKQGSEVLALIPVATNTSHWKRHIFGSAASICFLSDTRLKFRISGNEVNKGCPMAVCFVYWGRDPERFTEVFSVHGAVVRIDGNNPCRCQR